MNFQERSEYFSIFNVILVRALRRCRGVQKVKPYHTFRHSIFKNTGSLFRELICQGVQKVRPYHTCRHLPSKRNPKSETPSEFSPPDLKNIGRVSPFSKLAAKEKNRRHILICKKHNKVPPAGLGSHTRGAL